MLMVTVLPASGAHDTLLAAPANSPATVTFDDRSGQNQVLSGQYPTGVIDWGTNKWFHSGPWGAFTTKSGQIRKRIHGLRKKDGRSRVFWNHGRKSPTRSR